MLRTTKSLLLLALLASGCATGMPDTRAEVTGEAGYRERIAVPPGTRFTAVLEDVSLADAPSVKLAETVIDNAGQPPYRFSISYDPAQIIESHTYVLRTSLHHEGRLLFTSDTHTPVITGGNPKQATLVMRKVGALQGDAEN
jgi:putative lipoprotein